MCPLHYRHEMRCARCIEYAPLLGRHLARCTDREGLDQRRGFRILDAPIDAPRGGFAQLRERTMPGTQPAIQARGHDGRERVDSRAKVVLLEVDRAGVHVRTRRPQSEQQLPALPRSRQHAAVTRDDPELADAPRDHVEGPRVAAIDRDGLHYCIGEHPIA
jgi:hypothetical protein